MKALIGILLIIASVVTPVSCTIKSIEFKQNCSGYLKQAADANTVELAYERISMAIRYIETHNLTYGYTSILWNTEDENVEYWYKNIKACQRELEECKDGSQLEKSNVLMKVRESLTDNGDSGTVLTIPDGISRFPNNSAYVWWGWVSVIAFVIGVTLISCHFDD